MCSKSCGGGVMNRSRECDNPAPIHGGKMCEGSATDVKKCREKECPSKSNILINMY